MKKLILLSTVLLGAVTASQAGVHFNFGFGIPVPAPPVVVAPPPVYVAPPAPIYVAPPAIYAPAPVVVVPPRVVVAPPVIGFGFGHYSRPYWDYHHDGYRDYHYYRR